MDKLGASEELVEVPSNGSVEQTEVTVVMPTSSTPVSEASLEVSGCCEEKGQVQGECQNTERSIEGASEAQRTDNKELSASESDDTLKNKKPEECKGVSTEGKNLRLDLSAKLPDAIKDVSVKLEEFKDEYLSQRKENKMLRTNLKQLADQYACTEQQYAQQLEQKTVELQLAELKILQYEDKLVQEQSENKLYGALMSELLDNEKNLLLKLTAEEEKSRQLKDKLLEGNEASDKMANSIKELKKENVLLKTKSKKSDIAHIKLVELNEQLEQKTEKFKLAEHEIGELNMKLVVTRLQKESCVEQMSQLQAKEKELRLKLTADEEKFQQFKDKLLESNEASDKMAKSIKELKKENVSLKTKSKKSDIAHIKLVELNEQLEQKTEKFKLAEREIGELNVKLVVTRLQKESCVEQMSQLQAKEKELRLKLTADEEKFQQFKDTLLESNEAFDKMAKSIKELKKENVLLKTKSEESDIALIKLLGEHEDLKKQLEKSKNQKEKLESLCRYLQEKRKQNLVGSNNSDSAPI